MTVEQRKKMSLAKLGALNPRFGKPSTTLGRKHTDEEREKIRIARAKQVWTPEQKLQISKRVAQEWKDGLRKKESLSWYIDGRHEKNKPIKQSIEYRFWRKSVFERDEYTCQECKVKGGELQAHHLKPQSLFPELRFAIDNGQTLCRVCHLKTDSFGLRYDLLKAKLVI